MQIGLKTNYDIATLKYIQCASGVFSAKWSGVATESGESVINVYPNPNYGTMQVEYTLPENTTGSFEINDMTGKLVVAEQLRGGYNVFTISNTDLVNGIYFYNLISGDNLIARDKLVIIK